MTRSTFVLCLVALMTLSGCSKRDSAQQETATSKPNVTAEGKKITSLGVVRAEPVPTEISTGSSGEVTVHLVIQPGYHVNANPPTYPYLKATELKLGASAGISAGKVSYPKPVNRKFGFAEGPLDVYEGETDLRLVLMVEKSASKGQRSVPATIGIQACDDEVCYPPAVMNLMIPVTIK